MSGSARVSCTLRVRDMLKRFLASTDGHLTSENVQAVSENSVIGSPSDK